MVKTYILRFLNIFFLVLFGVALFVFLKADKAFDADKIIQNSALKEKKFKGLPVEIMTQNGVKIWLSEEHSAPLVALSFYFDKAGFAFDEENKQGLSTFVSSILLHGAGAFDEEMFQNLLDTNAIEMKFSASDEIMEGSMIFPKENIETATDMLNAVLTSPHMDEKDMEVIKRQQTAAIEMQNENPESVLRNEFKLRFFNNHPKGRLPLGVKEDIEGFSRQDLEDFVKTNFRTDNLTVAIAGDITPDEAKNFVSEIFKGLPDTGLQKELSELEANYDMKEDNIKRDIPQVISLFVAKGVKRSDEDFYPLYMVNEIFGGNGLSSRLNVRAREKEGLTYGAYTYLNAEKDAPRIVGTFSVSKENYEKMKAVLFDEWRKMARYGVQKEEFERVKNNMLTSFNLRFASLAGISKQLLYMQKENLGIDFLQKRNEYVLNTSFDAVNAAAQKYFADSPSILTIGN